MSHTVIIYNFIMKKYLKLGSALVVMVGTLVVSTLSIQAQVVANPISITPLQSTIASGESVKLNLSFPVGTTNANLYLMCPSGGGISTHTNPELCDTYIPVTSNIDWTLMLFNSSSQTQQVAIVYNVKTSGGESYSAQANISVKSSSSEDLKISSFPVVPAIITTNVDFQTLGIFEAGLDVRFPDPSGNRTGVIHSLDFDILVNGVRAESRDMIKDVMLYKGKGATYVASAETPYNTPGKYPIRFTNLNEIIRSGTSDGYYIKATLKEPGSTATALAYGDTIQLELKGISGSPINPAFDPVFLTKLTVTEIATPQPCYKFTLYLRLGSGGNRNPEQIPEVRALQKFLVSKRFKTDITGYFGIVTRAALADYQRSVGLPASGLFGPLTMEKVNADCNAMPSITVLSPNGESYGLGEGFRVKWTQSNFSPKNLNVYLNSVNLPNQASVTLGSFGASGQTYLDAQIPGFAGAGNDYTISVCDEGTPNPNVSFKPLCGTSRPFSVDISRTNVQPTKPIVITAVQYSPSSPSINTFVDTTVSINNSGSVAVDKGFRLLVQGTAVAIPSLAANTNTTITVPRAFSFSTPGLQVLNTVVLDPNGNSTHVFANTLSFNSSPNQPSITVMNPNGGESWTLGSRNTVTFKQVNFGGVQAKVHLIPELFNGTACLLKYLNLTEGLISTEVDLSQGCLNPNEFGKIIPGRYKIQIYAGNSLGEDTSDGYFTIASADTNQPSITITNPASGDTFKIGDTINAKWSTVNIAPNANLDVARLRNLNTRQEYNIANNITNDGIESWTIPYSVASGIITEGSYTLEIKSSVKGFPDAVTGSSAKFSIVSGTSEPSITVTSPNGGDFWRIGNQYSIDFSVNGDAKGPFQVYLDKYFEPGYFKTGVNSTVGLGETRTRNLPYTVPGIFNQFPGQGYTFKVRVCDATQNCTGPNDSSDGFFSIAPQVLMLYPNGGETLREGETVTIKWNKDNVPSTKVDISLLDDPTRYGSVILQSTPNDGAESWVVKPLDQLEDKMGRPIKPSGKYVTFVSCSDNNCIVDDSDSYFKITSSDSTNLPPVISGGTFPSTLKVGETGTWRINAYDPEQGPLSYSVTWGDENRAKPLNIAQTASFTHVYSTPGRYTVVFTVTDNKGASAKTSATVNVPGASITPAISVLAPEPGTTISSTERITVKWNQTHTANVAVITLYGPNTPYYVGKAKAFQGNNSFTLPLEASNVPAGQYRIEVCDNSTIDTQQPPTKYVCGYTPGSFMINNVSTVAPSPTYTPTSSPTPSYTSSPTPSGTPVSSVPVSSGWLASIGAWWGRVMGK